MKPDAPDEREGLTPAELAETFADIEPPDAARRLFGDRMALARDYAGRLADVAVHRGLLGPHEVPRLWERHLLNCGVLSELLAPGARLCDIGSGAGLPGLVLAVARPDLDVVLLEPLLRRYAFLTETVGALPLANVTVIRARAEEMHGRLHTPVVTARAVATLGRLAEWALPLLEPGGELLALKGASAESELRGAAPTLRRLGAVNWSLEHIGSGFLDPPATVLRITAGRAERRPGGAERGKRRR